MTAAYQAAAVQIMTAQISEIAARLDLPIPIPPPIFQSEVNPPPLGLGGSIVTSNYMFAFEKGKIVSISRPHGWMEHDREITNLSTLARYPMDTNGAYKLATQWLAVVSVDLSRVEQKWPLSIEHRTVLPTNLRNEDSRSIESTNKALPIFTVTWGKRYGVRNRVQVTIQGNTGQLIQMMIPDASLVTNQPLVITNASELLSPRPSKQQLTEKFVGGPKVYSTLVSPERIELSLIPGRETNEPPSKSIRASSAQRRSLSALLSNFDNYYWLVDKLCSPDYGAKADFYRGTNRVEVLICFECDILAFQFEGKREEHDFDIMHNELARIFKEAFPNNENLQKIEYQTEKPKPLLEQFRELEK